MSTSTFSRFTLSRLFTPWVTVTGVKTQPTTPGRYRVRTEKLSGAWWNGYAYWDGQVWWEPRVQRLGNLTCRAQMKVLQWQGLNMSVAQAVQTIKDNWPSSRDAQRRYTRFLNEDLMQASAA